MNKFYLVASYIYNPILLFWSFNRITEFYGKNPPWFPVLFVLILLITAIVSLFRANSVYNFQKQLKHKSVDVLDEIDDLENPVSKLWRNTTIGNLIYGFLSLGIFSYILFFVLNNNMNWHEYFDTKIIGHLVFSLLSILFSLIKVIFYIDLTRKIK